MTCYECRHYKPVPLNMEYYHGICKNPKFKEYVVVNKLAYCRLYEHKEVEDGEGGAHNANLLLLR